MITALGRSLLCAALLLANATPALARGPLVLAAASLQEALTAAANAWTAKGHDKPLLSFAASSALARQVETGAPADLFISADEDWMDYLAGKSLIQPATRTILLTNSLVLIAPLSKAPHLRIGPQFPLAAALGAERRLALADPDTVPAGKYGKAALQSLGVWASVAGRIARTENVRAALALVERGEAPLGIVYATDARASRKVAIIGTFPARTHPPIRYPLAALRTATAEDTERFRRFLLSAEGRAIFRRFGFQAG